MSYFRPKWKVFLLLIVLLQVVVYWNTLSFYFISDDFFFLTFNSLQDIFTPRQGLYHYTPVFWGFMYGINILAERNPLVYHAITLIIHTINVTLVYKVTKEITKSTKQALIAALLFSVFFSQYEVVMWVTGMNTSLMVLFGLVTLLVYQIFKRTNSTVAGVGIIIFSLASTMTHEYGVSFIISIGLFEVFIFQKKRNSTMSKPIYLAALCTLCFFAGKFIINNAPLSPSLNNPIYIMWYTAKNLTYLGIPNPYIVDVLSDKAVLITAIGVVLILVKSQWKNKIGMVLVSWVLFSIVLVSISSAPQARYLYFISIPYLILVTEMLKKKSKILQGFVYVCILISGVWFITAQIEIWKKTSQITKNILMEINNQYMKKGPEEIIVVNFPDSLYGPPWNAYLFRNGLENAVKAMYNHTVNVQYFRTLPLDSKVRDDKKISGKDLENLRNNNNAIFIFDYKTNTIDIL